MTTRTRRGFRYAFERANGHRCHHPACGRLVPPSLLACGPHWRALPAELQREIWRTYRKGQEIDKRPSAEYLAAAEACIAFWIEQDGLQGVLPL